MEKNLIYCQRDIPKNELRYGLWSSAATGCGWIAVYNILTLYGIPCLYIKESVNNFYDMTIDDFVMTNYNPMKPQLKLELGI